MFRFFFFRSVQKDKMKSREGDFGFSISPDVHALTLPAALHSASWATANGKEEKKKNTTENPLTDAKAR